MSYINYLLIVKGCEFDVLIKKVFIELQQYYLRSFCDDLNSTCVYTLSHTPYHAPNRFYEILSCTDVQISNVTQQSQLNILLMKSVSNFDSRWQYNLKSDKDKYDMM